MLNDLSPSKKEKLERLFRHPDWKAATDLVLNIPALDVGIQLGNVHTLMGMRCDEVNRLLLAVFVADIIGRNSSAIWITSRTSGIEFF
jgi:hypothetical protein